MSTAVVPVARQAALLAGPTAEQIALMKRTVAKGTSDDEFALFLHVCQRTGLDPFSRQIYCIMRGNPPRPTIQTSIDGFRLIAARTGRHAGTDDPEYDALGEAQPTWARVTVYKVVEAYGSQRCPFTATARWQEYAPYYYDKQTRAQTLGEMWAKMPYLMLGKCAEALALRKAFPQDLSGLYTHDEMRQAQHSDKQEELQILVLSEAIGVELERLGKDPDAQDRWWSDVRDKYGTVIDERLLQRLLDGLRKRGQTAARPEAEERELAREVTAWMTATPVLDPAPESDWREVLHVHGQSPELSKALRERIRRVTDKTNEAVGQELAREVMLWIEGLEQRSADDYTEEVE